MNVNNSHINEKKRKFSDGDERSKKCSKKENEDIKPNIEVISKRIKKEPEFSVREIKQEPVFIKKEIKKEHYESDTEPIATPITQPKSRKTGRKIRKTRKTVRKKRVTKVKKRTSKKSKSSTSSKKTKSNKKTSRKSTSRKRTKKKTGKKSKSSESLHTKKETKTLLDRQSSTNLRLFGFRDELEYFSSESDHEEQKGANLSSDIVGKRTSLSRLAARKKILLTLESISKQPPSKSKPVILPSTNQNVDVLGSILESQTLWHSKTSQMKVNEDGSVEVVNKMNKHKLQKRKSTGDKEINSEKSRMSVPAETRSDSCPLQTADREPTQHGSLELNENMGMHLTQVKIKSEPYDPAETQNTKTATDLSKEQTRFEEIKVKVKKEKEELTEATPTVLGPAFHIKTEKFDEDG